MTGQMQFSSGTWMAFGTFAVCTLLFAYIASERSRGSEVLAIELYRLNLGEKYDDRYPDIVPPEALKENSTLGDFVFGNTFEVPERAEIRSAKLNAATASQLKRTKAAEGIEFVVCDDSEIHEDAAFFPAAWKYVKVIDIYDTQLPKTWRDGLAGDSEHVIVMSFAGRTGMQVDDYLALGHLKLLTIRDGNLDQASIAMLKKELPNTRVIILPEVPEKISSTGPALSQRDAGELKKMRAAFSRLQTAVENAELGEGIYQVADVGWSEEQIVAFERSLGIPMHKSVRAFLEVQGGRWVRWSDPLFMDWSEKKWQPNDLVSRNRCGYSPLNYQRDFYDEDEPGFVSHELLEGYGPHFVSVFPLDEHARTFAIDLESGEYLRRGRGDYWVRMRGKTIYNHLEHYAELARRLQEPENAEENTTLLSYFEETEPRTFRVSRYRDYSRHQTMNCD